MYVNGSLITGIKKDIYKNSDIIKKFKISKYEEINLNIRKKFYIKEIQKASTPWRIQLYVFYIHKIKKILNILKIKFFKIKHF